MQNDHPYLADPSGYERHFLHTTWPKVCRYVDCLTSRSKPMGSNALLSQPPLFYEGFPYSPIRAEVRSNVAIGLSQRCWMGLMSGLELYFGLAPIFPVAALKFRPRFQCMVPNVFVRVCPMIWVPMKFNFVGGSNSTWGHTQLQWMPRLGLQPASWQVADPQNPRRVGIRVTATLLASEVCMQRNGLSS